MAGIDDIRRNAGAAYITGCEVDIYIAALEAFVKAFREWREALNGGAPWDVVDECESRMLEANLALGEVPKKAGG